MVDLVNNFLSQQFMNILWILSMILKQGFTVFEANIVSNTIIVLTNML